MSNILTNEVTKNKCQTFTPGCIVDEMLDLMEYKGNVVGKKVLENSFGSGNILVKIVERYIKQCLLDDMNTINIAQGLMNDIYGIELDFELYNSCINRLNKLLEGYNIPKVKWRLYNDNALIFVHETKYDFIVGNPPYINYRDLDIDSKLYIKENFTTCKKGKFDYCYAFIESAINCLSDSGKLVQIIPSSIFKNVFANELREMLKPHISKILDYPNQRIFNDALVSSSIFIYDKECVLNYVNYINRTRNSQVKVLRKDLQYEVTP